MTDRENRRYQMFVRVRDFCREHAADFSPTSLFSQLLVTLSAIVATLDQHAGSQASSRGSARQGTSSREQARAALREDLEAISRTARVMADDIVGLDNKFRLPAVGNDQNLLSSARAFLADAIPLEKQFVAHELPADFLDDLRADIAALEAAIGEQASGQGQSIAAGASIEQAIDDGVVAVRKFEVIIRNKYAHDRAVLAEWTSVSHTERDPRHKKTPAASGSPGSPNSPGGPASPNSPGSPSSGS
jgi:hypothetical protein